MFYRWLSRLAVSITLALFALAVVTILATPSSSAHPALSVVLTSSGGILSSADHQITVTVTSVTVKQPVTVTLSANITRTIPARFTVLGTAFAIETQGSILTPIQITAHYTLPAGVNEKDLLIVYYDTVADKWLPLSTDVDTTNHLAAASTNQTGQFALIARSAITSLPSNAVIVDDLNAGFAKFGPSATWHEAITSTQDFWAGHMWWTYGQISVRSNYATWTPALNTGLYDVYAFIGSYNTNTNNARYQIVHQGITSIRPISQSAYFAEWVKLGTYYFGNGTGNYVLLDDVTGESVLKRIGFDAIAFVPNKVYLPLVLNNYPPIKSKTGMHLGRRNDDWRPPGSPADFLRRIDGRISGAIWPAVAIVSSDELYYLDRRPESPCKIAQARVRVPNLYEYLTEAQRNGVIVLIRLHPSPGNFADWNDLALIHTLLSGTTPAGGDYCNGKHQQFRAIDDLADEMNEIYKLNVNQRGWSPTSFYFIPVNEPNTEWYSYWSDEEAQNRIKTPTAWSEMDNYFASLYDYVHSSYPNIRVLTPPMSQGNFAERAHLDSCNPMTVTEGLSGYDFMPNTYTSKNDGYAWNNYWIKDHETWATGSPCPSSHHVFQYFPEWMQTAIQSSSKPAFITEADLLSPCQANGNPITSKQDQPTETQESLRSFISQEQGADYVAAWLLTESPYSSLPYCLTGYPDTQEIKWHQAYREDGGERNWFWPFWSQADH
jgi:hypothetical protein